ncbi:MAG TPA: protein translocase subunit SecD [Clostridiales bacterium]|nr:protein translocase subunit SecD [Clostridiales bacterium]
MGRKKSLIWLLVYIAILGFLSYVAVFGLDVGRYTVIPIRDAIKQGLDLRGGVYIVYEPQGVENDPELESKLSGVMEILRKRLDDRGLTEATIATQGREKIRVEIPDIDDHEEALELLGKTAKLEFIDEEGNVIIDGKDVANAEANYGEGMKPMVFLELNDEGAEKFYKGTQENIDKIIKIVLDDVVISAPVVNEAIPNGQASISGSMTIDDAAELASLIKSGALPIPIEPVEVRTVGATLGSNALTTGIQAGFIGLIAVFVFMIAFYRLPGLMADIALITYLLIVLIILAGIGATLTLPGIAGIILSVGMAVDANVIIFERFKEELETGKTLRSSLDSGFSKAFRAILDSNITTLIATIVLYIVGTGPVQGFALTLGIGIVVSLFTAITLTKFLLRLVMGLNLKNKKLYSRGVKG